MKNKQLQNLLKNFISFNKSFNQNKPQNFFDNMKDSQSPEVTLLTCCDSRVHINCLTDNPQNNIFTVRNIGNQISTNEGAIEFGVNILKTPNLIIMGHSNCGAVNAAIQKQHDILPKNISKEISLIPTNTTDINTAILDNVNHQVEIACNKFAENIKNNELKVVGMLYDFSNHYGYGAGSLFITNINHEKIELGGIENNYMDILD